MSPAQRPADPGPEQGPGAERVSGAGVGPAGPPVPGEASPLPGPLHPLPAGAAGLPERLQRVLILCIYLVVCNQLNRYIEFSDVSKSLTMCCPLFV